MKTKSEVQREALDIISNYSRCGIGLSVGMGKTLLALLHMDNCVNSGLSKFLIVAPKKSIFKTWTTEASKYNLQHLIDKMKFTTYLSLTKQSLSFDVVYLDECHSLKTSHEPWLSSFTGYILGLTGTPPKFRHSEKGYMVNKFCPIVYRYLLDTGVSDKLLNDYRIFVHKLNLSRVKSLPMQSKDKKKTWMSSELDSYNYWTDRIENADSPKILQILRIMRMKALQQFPSKEIIAESLLNSMQGKTILFANTQEQADKLCSVSYHSNNPKSEQNLEKFKEGTYTKLSCVLQLNEGVNIPDLKSGIIIHSFGNERQLQQRIGRLMRLNPNDTATVHILCYKNTVDEDWVRAALSDFDPLKIQIINY